MATSIAPEEVPVPPPDTWGAQDDRSMGPAGNAVPSAGASPLPVDDHSVGQDPQNPDYVRGSSVSDSVSGGKGDNTFRDKQVKPNKVYIGGLPEHTRQEDLQTCFGKIGNITNIELKNGFGFVEFDSVDAAEESVAKYHEGHFMGNKIRVELSRGGGRTAKYAGDPGACFKCGQMGHWARECPNNVPAVPLQRHGRPPFEPPLVDRLQRDYVQPPPRNYPRDDYGPPGRYPPRDPRYDYPHPPPREYRRPPSPGPYRDYPPPPPPPSRGREYEDYRRAPPGVERDRYAPPPPPPPPPSDYRSRYAPPPDPGYRGYGGPPPPAPMYYERYDRRPNERYPQSYPAPQPPGVRSRSPMRPREDFDRLPPAREYGDYRGRGMTPPRYPDYPRPGSTEPPPGRYRRRSESPPLRTPTSYDGGYMGNGAPSYPPYGGPPGPPRGGLRDYPPPRGGRESPSNGGYRRPM